MTRKDMRNPYPFHAKPERFPIQWRKPPPPTRWQRFKRWIKSILK